MPGRFVLTRRDRQGCRPHRRCNGVATSDDITAWPPSPRDGLFPTAPLVCIAITLALTLTLAGGRAFGETADEAKESAAAAAAQVAALQDDVDRAAVDYQRSLDAVAGAVTRSVQADRAAMMASEQARLVEVQRVQTVRTLEQSGGALAVFDTVLAAESPGDLAARWQLSQQVLDLLSDRSQSAVAASGDIVKWAARTGSSAQRSIATVADVAATYEQLQELLDEQQRVLDELDSRARELAAVERAAERIAAEQAAAAEAALRTASTATAQHVPVDYFDLYRKAAAKCPGMPWTILAAVGQVESGHGSNTSTSPSGAQGPMQFLPSTFVAYAVDGDRDGDADILNPADAIYTAANYLCANGAGAGARGLYTALWHYNHADWYVTLVVQVAGQIAAREGEPAPVVQAP